MWTFDMDTHGYPAGLHRANPAEESGEVCV